MDQETKNIISKIQQAVWKLEQANLLLEEVPGFADYTQHIEVAIGDLTAEMDELQSIE